MTILQEIFLFIKNISHDQRIPTRDKKFLVFFILLLVSPFDLIPDWIPVFGLLDDFVIISVILDYFFQVLDSRIILSHYPWGMKSFARLKSLSTMTQFMVPKFIRNFIWKYVPDPY